MGPCAMHAASVAELFIAVMVYFAVMFFAVLALNCKLLFLSNAIQSKYEPTERQLHNQNR